MASGFLKRIDVQEFDSLTDRDTAAMKLVDSGKIVHCSFSGSGYPAVYIYELLEVPADIDTFKIEIDGKLITACWYITGRNLKPGDLYIAKRNTGWQLAKCLYVNQEEGWVMPDPPASVYSYDCWECHKVIEVKLIV